METRKDPLHDWRVRAGTPSGLADAIASREPPLVGREDLLAQFDRLAARARVVGTSVLALTGEPGIGKTRVLRAFAERARPRGLEVAWAGTSTSTHGFGSRRVWPLVVLCDGVVEASRVLPSFELCPRELGDGRLIVVAYAPGDGERPAADHLHQALAAAARQGVLVEASLSPLSDPELVELTTHVLGGPPDAELLHVLSSLSEGNPYLATQMLLDLTRSGVVAPHGPTWQLRGHLRTDFVPAAVASMAAHTLSCLDSATTATLASAAAVGPGFQFELLATICSLPPEEVLRHLEVGLARGFIREAPEPPDDFQFVHELFRRCLYGSLNAIRRRQVHQAIGAALEARACAPDADGRAALLAYHFGRGLDPQQAFRYTLRALKRAEHLGAWEDAIRNCREALEFARQANAGEEVELGLFAHLGGLYFGRAQTFAAGTCWREALRICESSGDLSRRALLVARLAALGPAWQPIEEAERALAAAEKDGAGQESVWAFDTYIELGMANERHGRLRQAIAYLRRAAELVRGEDPWACGLALTNLGDPLTNSGQPGEAVEVLRAALDLLEQPQPADTDDAQLVEHLRDPRRARCLALADLARALAYLGDLDQALEIAECARAEEQRLDIRGGRSHRALAQVELAQGRPEAALEVLVRARSYGATELLGAHRAADLMLLAHAHLDTGDTAASLQTARDGIRICERSGAHEHLAGLYVVAGRALVDRGETAAAMDAVQRAQTVIELSGTALYRPDVLRLEGEVGRAQGLNGTERLAREADALARSMGLAGASWLSQARTPAASEAARVDRPARGLSQRELEVLALVAEGRSNRSIAESLVLSDKTVKRHLSNILDKLGVTTRAAAVSHGLRLGLF